MTKNSRQVSDGQVLIRTHAERKDKELAGLSSKSSRFRILRFASAIDLLMLIAAITASVINGVLVPIFSIIFGNLVNAFGNSSNLSDKVNENALYLVYLAIAALIAGYVEVGFLAWMGFRQARSLRCAFVSSVMQQDIAWFDCHGGTNKLIQGLNEDSAAYESAISNRLGHFIRNITTCIAGLIVAFSRGWSMTLVILSTLPLLIGVGIGISVVTTRLQRMISRANQKSNGNALAQEALLNIRTLCSYNLQQQIVDRFGDCLEEPIRAGVKQGLLSGLTIGATAGVFSCSYALAIWYGSRQVADGNYDGGKVINILFAGVMAGFSLGQALPNIRFLQAGQVAFSSMCEIIDREPPIESNTEKGTVLDELNGDIEFEDVTFSYPIRPDRTVFQDFNLVIPAGTSVALVGPSGSGKSTIIQLLERFYDPVKGRILVDGYNLMDLNLEWWRTQVSLVSQEPTLFNLTIYENIAMAKPGCSMEEVMSAATSANAHAFITKLPDGYTTSVGAQGLQLSGGQRQRIAIARAILRNPHILLLDEATSALDNQSEKAVQESLEKLMAYRTTVIIAHRLTTVVNADNIAIVSNGQVIDQGTHRELLSREGFYSNLVSKQAFDTMEEDDEEQEVALTRKTTKKQVELRKSVLTRSSVRLSVIPQDIMNRLRKRKQENEEELKPVNLKRLLVLNKPEWRFGILGIIASACFGLQTPAFSIALSYVVNIFFKPTAEEIRSGGEKWAGIYVAIGVGCLLAGMVQGWAFAIMGQRLAARIKLMFIAAVLRQDVGWHDLPEHGTGKMMNSLIKDTMSIRGAIGDQAGVLVQNLATLIASLTIAFTASWKLTLVILSVLPLLLIAQFVQVLMITGQFKNEEDSESTSCGMALEGVRNIKIVNAYNVQGHISRNFAAAIPVREAKRSAHIAGIAYGFSQFVLYNVICLAFWYGSKIVLKGQLDFQELMMAFCALFFATFSIAQANVQFPDIGKAQESAKAVFGIIDNKPKIDIYAQGGARLPMVNGDIELENVTFAYPNRPDRLVLKHFSLKIPAGSSCALVGESGHGKSTIVGLVERFYDAIGGKVLLDGIDITKLNLRWLRNQIGVVSQEPVLFRGSIMENIALGNLEATTADVIEAAKYAYAYDFINALPEQFETKVGDGGVQLSGGQKQRIAIARAILKNPKVLLLDEATSALDAESEEIVQAAVDEIMVGRTSIIIAHRLNTIRNVDKIAAIYRGRVLEEGTHEDLMQLDRYYAYLVKTSQM